MCFADKCLFFISLRTGSLIFGYFNAVITGAGTIACIIAAMTFWIQLIFPESYYPRDNFVNIQLLTTVTVMIISGFLIQFLSGFICSVLLIVGITKKKTALIKTYIFYGMIEIGLLFTFFIILHLVTQSFTSGFVIMEAAILGVYTSCLYMIFLTCSQRPPTGGNVFHNPQANTDLIA